MDATDGSADEWRVGIVLETAEGDNDWEGSAESVELTEEVGFTLGVTDNCTVGATDGPAVEWSVEIVLETAEGDNDWEGTAESVKLTDDVGFTLGVTDNCTVDATVGSADWWRVGTVLETAEGENAWEGSVESVDTLGVTDERTVDTREETDVGWKVENSPGYTEIVGVGNALVKFESRSKDGSKLGLPIEFTDGDIDDGVVDIEDGINEEDGRYVEETVLNVGVWYNVGDSEDLPEGLLVAEIDKLEIFVEINSLIFVAHKIIKKINIF